MLEKIGLPAKPSMRGGSWVVDASHCQGCSSQFTFINRKHHCRRCGGLFCNSCTQQRMILRGQGDSPVRICDPCKKLEDAARFELRYGHKNRTAKGSLKLEPKHEEEILSQILEAEGKQQLSIREPHCVMVSSLQKATSSASSSNCLEETITLEGQNNVLRSSSIEINNNMLKEMGSNSPEELRLQAAEEKKKYKILKGEGKSEEALQAFKRGKDLERQAGALEIALRKSRREAALNNSASSQKRNDSHEGSIGKNNIASQSSRVAKDDLLSELRELGWSDADLHDADKKPVHLSLEGELSSMIKEVPSKSNAGKGSSGIDNSQVLAYKRKALLLKREGKLGEAKEELKKAKLLEKQLEEQELLGQADDSDDELSSLIHNMDDDDKQDDELQVYGNDLHINFDSLSGLDNLVFDDNFDVTNDDMNDPEIAATLKLFGWSEEDDHVEEESSKSVLCREALESEVLSLKREAVKQKHAGNISEARELLRKAKLLEKDLETTQHESAPLQKKSMHQNGRPSMSETDDKNITEMKRPDVRPKPRSKLLIQRELLDLKKKALALRREGRTDEADEELRKGKELERLLQEVEDAPTLTSAKADGSMKDRKLASIHHDISADLGVDEEETEEVTEEDMSDPALLSDLQNFGWVDEHAESASNPGGSSKQINDQSMQEVSPSVIPAKLLRNKAEIQRELLGIKRKALALRRQGKVKEAEDELEKAKSLEKQMADMEIQHMPEGTEPLEMKTDVFSNLISEEKSKVPIPADELRSVIHTSSPKSRISNDKVNSVDTSDVDSKNGCTTPMLPPVIPAKVLRNKAEIQRELLGIKRKAFALRRQGKIKEAEDELEKAKSLETQMAEMEVKGPEPLEMKTDDFSNLISEEKSKDLVPADDSKSVIHTSFPKSRISNDKVNLVDTCDVDSNNGCATPLTLSDRFTTGITKLESSPTAQEKQKVVEHWTASSKLGNNTDQVDFQTGADQRSLHATVLKPKNKESRGPNIPALEHATPELLADDTANPKCDQAESVGALNTCTVEKKQQPVTTMKQVPNSEENAAQGFDSLNDQILARKRKAVALKREGKLAEAREELRQAKLLEKTLEDGKPQVSEASQSSSASRSAHSSDVSASKHQKSMSGRDRLKLQQESLAHKRLALKLRREGRIEESDAELELAKALEAQLEEIDNLNPNNKKGVMDDAAVEDLLDPQLLSALKSIGWAESDICMQSQEKSAPKSVAKSMSSSSEGRSEAKPSIPKSTNISPEKSALEEQINSEKLRAVNLKRAGKQAEALEALRSAKRLEKRLISLS